jgi:Flp pilus assembly CpaE family ATPase
LESLNQRECLAQQYVVINRFLPSSGELSTQRIAEILQVSKVFTVANDFASVAAAQNAGQLLRKATPGSHALADITELARALLGIGAESPQSGWSLMGSWNQIAQSFHHST